MLHPFPIVFAVASLTALAERWKRPRWATAVFALALLFNLSLNARYLAAFARVFPAASERRLRLIQHLAIASMVHVLSGQLEAELTIALEADAEDRDATHEPVLQALIAHSAAGARAIAEAKEA